MKKTLVQSSVPLLMHLSPMCKLRRSKTQRPKLQPLKPLPEKSSEENKTAASENTAPVPAEQADQATTEDSTKISREVANPELQQQLVQRLNESVEKSSIHPEKLADMEMDTEIKRLASLKNKDKSDNLSDNQIPQEAKANFKENASANTWAQFVAQQTKPSSSNAQSKSDKPSPHPKRPLRLM